ncbi:MAG: phospho-sugar mutase [Clostridiaceae bacterium]|nr:phospho-sugar mutase [Clostridiaceae bacterium]
MMSSAMKLYQEWLSNEAFDEKTRAELAAIAGDQSEIEDRFYTSLSFGTAGLRGVLGAGTNRMNFYTVAAAADAFAQYIVSEGDDAKKRGIAISYDSRNFSREFAVLTARIFTAHGVKVYLSDELRPVPLLSFAIRYYKTYGGVMITASHNPARYNGFKAYGEDGGQMPPEAADVIADNMNRKQDLPSLLDIHEEVLARQGDLWQDIGEDLDQAYNSMLLSLAVHPEAVKSQKDLKIVYTPLHGSGNKPVRRILASMGFNNVLVVPEQEQPDGNFPTVSYPNPEEREALDLAIKLAASEGADLVIATDPDADRTGLCVRDSEGKYQVLTGNQIGLLLMDYILKGRQETGSLPEKSFVVNSIVSTRLSRRVAAAYGVEAYEVLTGFKYIGEMIKQKDEFGDWHFQFGFEESFGYLAGTDVRDKDAVVASMLIAEMAAVAAGQGKTIYDLLQELYQRFGYAAEKTVSITLEGKAGIEKIQSAMSAMRTARAQGIEGVAVKRVLDFADGTVIDMSSGSEDKLDFPASDVLLYELDGLDWFCIRPSGTEPKIKIYFGVYGDDLNKCRSGLAELEKIVREALQKNL